MYTFDQLPQCRRVVLPSAPGSFGEWYQVWLPPEEDEKIQKVALALARRRKIWDSKKRRFVKPQPKPSTGELYVPHYAVAKYALTILAEAWDYSKGRPKPKYAGLFNGQSKVKPD